MRQLHNSAKQTFLAEIAREELQKKGQLFVFWTGIFWSPDSRDALNAVGTEVLRVLKAARHRCRGQGVGGSDERDISRTKALELALREAHFSAAHARRQYDAVDPANRLVASEYLGHLTA